MELTAEYACDKKKLRGFLSDALDLDDQLEFLLHLERCTSCWNELYSAAKAEHPHYYRTDSRRKKTTWGKLGTVRPRRQAEDEELLPV